MPVNLQLRLLNEIEFYFVLLFVINQLPMIQEAIQQYEVQINEFGVLFQQDQQGFTLKNFFEEFELLKTPEIRTYHTDNLMDSNSINDLRSQPFDIKCQSQEIQKHSLVTRIECRLNVLLDQRKSKKGRQKEKKNIYQILKCETDTFLSIQIRIGILSEQDRFRAEKFKQETTCAKSFIQLLKSQKVKQKLVRFYYSPDFVQSIMKNSRLSFGRKIQVIKHFNMLAKILNQRNY